MKILTRLCVFASVAATGLVLAATGADAAPVDPVIRSSRPGPLARGVNQPAASCVFRKDPVPTYVGIIRA